MHVINNSERLSYRLMDENDELSLWQLDQDPEVMRYINGGKPTPIETTRNVYLPRLKSYTNAQKGWGMWRIALTDSDEFLGWILVRPMDFFTDQPIYSNLELGWRLHRSAWGKGYATEAAKAVMHSFIKPVQTIENNAQQESMAKKSTPQKSIPQEPIDSCSLMFTAIALPGNKGSFNIMKKLGMKYLKTGIYKDPLGDETVHYYQYKPNDEAVLNKS